MAYPPNTARKVKICSILHLVAGAIFVISGVLNILIGDSHNFLGYVGFGIWGGIWIIVTGVLGLVSITKENPNTPLCYIGTFMGFSIVVAVMSGFMMLFYGVFWVFARKIEGFEVLFTLLNILELVLSILTCVVCGAVCCRRNENVQVQVVIVGDQSGQQVMYYVQQGQLVPMVAPVATAPPTMQVVPQVSPAQAVQAATMQPGWQQAPPPYSGPVATGDVNAEKT